MLYGAIIGDIAGSRFEFNNWRSKDFQIFSEDSFFTDDTLMTLAVAVGLAKSWKDGYKKLSTNTIKSMQEIGQPYPYAGWGGNFHHWMYSKKPQPYNSFGNGAAMRVSAVGWFAQDTAEVINLSRAVTEISHNHEEGIKGAESVAMLIYFARLGADKAVLRSIANNYYHWHFTLDEIRDTYEFNETCQDTVPQAMEAFFESNSFEDAIRLAVSVGGDSDTLAAITGSIAEAFYGVPEWMKKEARGYLNKPLLDLLDQIDK